MPVQIGAKTHSFSEPTGLLSDCHRRVEMFLGGLKAVSEIAHRPLDEQTRHSLELALRYFREAAPKHTADEEVSLFPVLRTLDNDDVKLALEKISALEEDHRWAEPLHQRVDELGAKCLQNGSLDEQDAKEFREAIAHLQAMYARHIEIEDKDVFPVAARALSAEQKARIAAEMAARRR
ncbi:MAG TPA: hemerythrin domain-containing protein [Terriglobales bacterium]|nr:hemerythrin domain-containing protein [Terriglobales bacterium]